MPAQIHPNALKPGSGRGGGSSFKRAASQASMSLGSFRKPIAQQRNERGLRRTVDVAPTDSRHAGTMCASPCRSSAWPTCEPRRQVK